MRPTLERYFLGIALAVRERACCTGNRVGAVLVRDRHIVAAGYNGTPAGAPNCDEGGCHRFNHPQQYPSGSGYDLCTCLHAEQNAILRAAKFGTSVEGAACYTTMCPAPAAARNSSKVGVTEVHYIHDWAHADPAYQRQYLALQAGFTCGVHRHDIPDPKADWAVGRRRVSARLLG